jgi:hypothetical protein
MFTENLTYRSKRAANEYRFWQACHRHATDLSGTGSYIVLDTRSLSCVPVTGLFLRRRSRCPPVSRLVSPTCIGTGPIVRTQWSCPCCLRCLPAPVPVRWCRASPVCLDRRRSDRLARRGCCSPDAAYYRSPSAICCVPRSNGAGRCCAGAPSHRFSCRIWRRFHIRDVRHAHGKISTRFIENGSRR